MRTLLSLLFFCITSLTGTAQATALDPDLILFEGETSPLHSYPLRTLVWKGEIKIESGGICSGSIGYKAFWRIEDNQLFLEKVIDNQCSKPREVNLETQFSGKKPPILANWYSGILVVTRGKLKEFVNFGLESVYEGYVVLLIKKGQVVSRVDYDEPPR